MTPAVAGLTILGATVALYFLPTIVAVARRSPLAGYVVMTNLVFGWTVVGWFLALGAALRRVEQSQPATVFNIVMVDGKVVDLRSLGEPSYIDAEARDA